MDRIERIRQSFITKKTEASDTHDYIQRHDPDFNKKNPKQQDQWKDHEEDMTDISVQALIIFLEGLKRDNDSYQTNKDEPINPMMKKAISAYDQSNKPEIKKRYTYLDEQKNEEIIDHELVENLIQSLQSLLDKDIHHINLLNSGSFLKSIEKTVEKYESL